MCGICGIVNYRNAPINEELLRKMCLAMQHRGPDDEGFYLNKVNPFVGLGHRRLSIIDLSPAGHQPMANEDKTVWLVFNGEVYNFPDLKAELIKKSHVFKSNTDTETIIHLYEEFGEECVKYLRGMFAFAIWDEKRQILLLARDRVGKKPLLYQYLDGIFCFASEFLALLESGLIKKEINYEALDSYLTYGYIPAPLTIFKAVFKLPPAHILVLKNGNLTIKKYWDLDYSHKIKISEQDAADEILKLLKEATRIRLYSDVPLGAFLSGGIDSSTVVGLMSQLSDTKVKTFSIGFEEKDFSELHYARNIAQRFSTEHHEFIVKPDALKVLPLLVEHYGEPYADSSCIPTYYVSQQTRRYVTVALNGDGGDESFAGYKRYQAMLLAERMPKLIKETLRNFLTRLPHSVNSRSLLSRAKRFLNATTLSFQERYIKWIGIFDGAAKTKIYSEEFLRLVSGEAYLKAIKPFLDRDDGVSVIDALLRTDTMTYLPYDLLVKVDIASMANSLEARSPFLDHKLMEFAARLPAEYKMKRFIKKYILKKAIKGLIPEENIYRQKMGFGVPVGEWFRGELKNFLCEILLSKRFFERRYFKPEVIKGMVKAHIEKQTDYTFQLWALLMLELWHNKFID